MTNIEYCFTLLLGIFLLQSLFFLVLLFHCITISFQKLIAPLFLLTFILLLFTLLTYSHVSFLSFPNMAFGAVNPDSRVFGCATKKRKKVFRRQKRKNFFGNEEKG